MISFCLQNIFRIIYDTTLLQTSFKYFRMISLLREKLNFFFKNENDFASTFCMFTAEVMVSY